MTLLQLSPSIPVYVTSKDNAYGRALGWIDYGEEHPIVWIIGLENGEVWCVRNEEIRLTENWTMNYTENRQAEHNKESKSTIVRCFDCPCASAEKATRYLLYPNGTLIPLCDAHFIERNRDREILERQKAEDR